MAVVTDALGAFPADGGLQPFAAGRIEFDFLQNVVRAPNGSTPLGLPQGLPGNVNACTLFVDTFAQILLPDYGSQNFLTAGDHVYLPIHLDRLTVVTTLPCNIALIATSREVPPTLTAKSVPQLRQSSMTLTKINGLNVEDPWQDVIFAPVYGSKSISQAAFGMAKINCTAYPCKTFIIRNVVAPLPSGNRSIEVRVVGAVSEDQADRNGYVADQDAGGLLKTGVSDNNVVRTSQRWAVIKLQARVQSAYQAGGGVDFATFVVEYVGSPEAIVESSALIPIGPASATDTAATGTGAISLGAAPDAASRFVRLEVTFNVAPVTSELMTLTMKAVRGTAYNVVWFSVDPSSPAQASVVWPGGAGYDMLPGDQLSLAYNNTDGRTYTARIIWESQTI